MSIYDYTVRARKGATLNLSTLKGKVLLVVNTATGCGFTPQYKALEELYEKYHGQGLEVLDFPCNQFGHQAPGDEGEIHEFCTLTYKTQFDQLAKTDVNGPDAEPLFVFLKAAIPEDEGPKAEIEKLRKLLAQHGMKGAEAPGDIEWNFTKFLVDRSGNVVHRYHPTSDPAALAPEIEKLLAAQR